MNRRRSNKPTRLGSLDRLLVMALEVHAAARKHLPLAVFVVGVLGLIVVSTLGSWRILPWR